MTPIHRATRALPLAALLLCLPTTACSDLPPLPIGELQLGLVSDTGPVEYRLTRAEFAIVGEAAEVELSTSDDPDARALQRSLTSGSYRVELRDGWQLEQSGPGGARPVEARLISDNPLDFEIASGELTTLSFQFETADAAPSLGSAGRVRLAIEVNGVSAAHVVISEVMRNPQVLPDAEGEWFELYNAGPREVDLGGCTLSRDERHLTLDGEFPIAAGGYLTFANGEGPGFAPDVIYSGITLPNDGSFELRLTCGQQLIDSVPFDDALLPSTPGRSWSLSGSSLDDVSNDLPSNWCEGVASYNGDTGSPGYANPGCNP